MKLQFGQLKRSDTQQPKPVPSWVPTPWELPLIDRRKQDRPQPQLEIEIPQPPSDWKQPARKSPDEEHGVCVIQVW
ncbi:hypothetical protein H0O00_00215 [Candidatus Micrarchaeota archaeon]|nr:hypothetical protein [Candidatus Micrarchaeota archaeon]